MSIILAGVSHHNTPLSIRERLYFPEGDMSEWLDRLADYRGLDERLILSTCNRVEVYSVVEDYDQGLDAIHRFFLESRDIGAEELNAHLYVHREDEATRHLFTVASSLDSMVVGEPQILGQVKEAYRVAQASGHAGKSLTNLFSRAFRVAKKIREQTPIGESPVSVSSVAVDLAKRIFGSLSGKNVLLLGAGEMGEAAARHLKASGADTLQVANRTLARAEELAAKLGGLALSFDNLEEALIDADVVITSTASQGFILDKPAVAAALERRRDAPVFLIDIAVPRNVSPDVNDLENAYLYDVDDLQSVAADNLRGREEVARDARAILESEVETYLARQRAEELRHTFAAIRFFAESMRQEEVEKTISRLSGLDEDGREALEAMTKALVNKLLHHPFSVLRRMSEEDVEGISVESVQKLFGVEPESDEDPPGLQPDESD
ncbi:MAG: glutamyl-tRNA reductase [Nitrospinae bacterium]|nr:glutamyl-tRNA reductase [Nitrospinota bacterium]